jgi:murein DD-endopeptidase MepM/ murein hydrolase activator NlpD
MNNRWFAWPLALATALSVGGWRSAAASNDGDPAPLPSVSLAAEAPLPPDQLIVALEVPAGATFGALMSAHALPERTLREAALKTYDLARIRPDRELQITYVDGDELPTEVRYQIDDDRTLVLTRAEEAWSSVVEEVAYTVTPVWVGLEIRSSLWDAVIQAGLPPADLHRIAGIFEYLVDFNTELQPGDKVHIVGEMRSALGRPDKLGVLHAVRFVGASRRIEAVRFPRENEPDAWYMPDRTALVRMFLRSPLEFSRVTSGFNPKRFHPILKQRRPHNGTDFGAPTGTLVRTVADGVVVEAGSSGGHGNFVKVRHDDTYTTSYSHLSRILVRQGQRVNQGDHIGKVGATGLATGPHLHYQMWRHDKYVDPMRIELPLSKQLDPAELPGFDALVATWLPQLPPEDFVGQQAR